MQSVAKKLALRVLYALRGSIKSYPTIGLGVETIEMIEITDPQYLNPSPQLLL